VCKRGQKQKREMIRGGKRKRQRERERERGTQDKNKKIGKKEM